MECEWCAGWDVYHLFEAVSPATRKSLSFRPSLSFAESTIRQDGPASALQAGFQGHTAQLKNWKASPLHPGHTHLHAPRARPPPEREQTPSGLRPPRRRPCTPHDGTSRAGTRPRASSRHLPHSLFESFNQLVLFVLIFYPVHTWNYKLWYHAAFWTRPATRSRSGRERFSHKPRAHSPLDPTPTPHQTPCSSVWPAGASHPWILKGTNTIL